jgi:hypothetical protein
MATTPEPVQHTDPPSQESGLWILCKLILFLFAIPGVLLFGIKQLLH